jgi:hypothetical protein
MTTQGNNTAKKLLEKIPPNDKGTTEKISYNEPVVIIIQWLKSIHAPAIESIKMLL